MSAEAMTMIGYGEGFVKMIGNKLVVVGTDSEAVYTALKNALAYPPTVTPSTVYGDGRAAQRIAEITDFILSQ